MIKLFGFIIVFVLFSPIQYGANASALGSMNLIGTGKAYYLKFIQVYDAALYSEDLPGGEDILSTNVSKCLHLQYSVAIEKDDFITAANNVLKRQYPIKKLDRVSNEIAALHDGYRSVSKGDRYTLCYNREDKTTTLDLNGERLVSIQSPEFAGIYFSIWLGSHAPLDENLRQSLLAGAMKKM